MKKFIKDNCSLLILCLSFVLLECLFFYVLKKPFIVCNDHLVQNNIFYKEWVRLLNDFLDGKGLPMYSWNMFLGSDFLSSMAINCSGDIFIPIILLTKEVEVGLEIETVLCVFISAILMRKLLVTMEIKNNFALLLVPFIYAVSGQAILYVGNYMFHRFYAFLPLLFIGIRNYIDNKKPVLFILATFILFLQNFYFMYPTCIFIFLFCLFELLKREKGIKESIMIALKMIGYFFVGFLCSGIISIPAITYLLNNPRVGNNNSIGLIWGKEVLFGLYTSWISYNPFLFTKDIFCVGNEEAWNIAWYNLSIGIFPLGNFLHYIFEKKNRKDFLLFIILLLFLILKPLSSAMHGFSVPSFRWVFLLEFYVLVYSAKNMDYSELNVSYSFIYLIFYFLILIFILVFNSDIIYEGQEHFTILVISFVYSLVTMLMYLNKKTIYLVLSILFPALGSFYMLARTTDSFSFYEETIKKDYIDYIKDIDDDLLFRFYYDPKDINPGLVNNLNKSLELNIMTTNTYCSTYETEITDFINSGVNDMYDWQIKISNPYACTSLGVKYYIVNSEKDLPQGLNYSYYSNLDTLKVYKNEDYRGIAYTMDKIDSFINLQGDLTKYRDYILIDDLNFDISKYIDLEKKKLSIYEYGNNYLKGDILLQNDNILCISLPNNKGWKIYVNGEKVNPISVNGGFIGVKLDAGYNNIEMFFVSPYLKIGCITSIAGVFTYLLIIVYERMRYEC